MNDDANRVITTWLLLFIGGMEAVEGFRQLYGFAASHHGLYALTGSFYNPGPYMGFLAVVLPVVVSLPRSWNGPSKWYWKRNRKYTPVPSKR